MTRCILIDNVKEIAKLLHPNDWDGVQEVALRGFYNFNKHGNEIEAIMGVIHFHWEMALLTDYIVSHYNLPMPGNQICILWERIEISQCFEVFQIQPPSLRDMEITHKQCSIKYSNDKQCRRSVTVFKGMCLFPTIAD